MLQGEGALEKPPPEQVAPYHADVLEGLRVQDKGVLTAEPRQGRPAPMEFDRGLLGSRERLVDSP